MDPSSNRGAAAALRERIKGTKPAAGDAKAEEGEPTAKRRKSEGDEDVAVKKEADGPSAAADTSPRGAVKHDPVSLGYVKSSEALDLLADEPKVNTDQMKDEYAAADGDLSQLKIGGKAEGPKPEEAEELEEMEDDEVEAQEIISAEAAAALAAKTEEAAEEAAAKLKVELEELIKGRSDRYLQKKGVACCVTLCCAACIARHQ